MKPEKEIEKCFYLILNMVPKGRKHTKEKSESQKNGNNDNKNEYT